MPIYEYRCQDCGAVCERLLLAGDGAADFCCTHCGSSRMERIISAATFVSANAARQSDKTCCGQEERCDSPPCSSTGSCRRG